MRRPLLLSTRPEDELARCTAAAARHGFAILSAPMLGIESLPFVWPQGDFDALLFTSPRSPALVAPAVARLRSAPSVFCVGPRTAEMAQKAGFAVEWTGDSDGNAALQELARRGCRRVISPGGAHRIALQVPGGIELVLLPVYRAVASDRLPPKAISALQQQKVAATLLFSPRTARLFAGAIDRQGIARRTLAIVALSDNVSHAAGEGWRAVAIARRPELAAMLDAAGALPARATEGRRP